MTTGSDIESAIGGFYDAATGQADWARAFDRLLAATGFHGAAFYVVDRATRTAVEEIWHNLDPAYADVYLRDYITIDPRAAQVFVPDAPRVLYDYLHTPEPGIDRDPFYAWFQPSQRMRYYVGGQSAADEPRAVTLTLHRPGRLGHATAAELEIFGRLFDHFEHAVRLQHRLGLRADEARASQAAIETAAYGVIWLDRNGLVLRANAAAHRIAARGDALRLTPEGPAAIEAGDRLRLAHLIRSVLAGAVAAPLRLARNARPPAPDYVVTGWRVPRGAGPLPDAAGVLHILDPEDSAPKMPIAAIARLYDLTRQEAAVLRELLTGAEPAAIALTLGLRAASVRTYLAAIYRKTGCARQGELIARMGFLARALEPPR